MVDPIARSEDPVGILWRKRLALSSAVAVSQLEGRREGEAQLRDALALCKPGDDPGPAGRMLLGWRALGEARALRSAEWPGRLPGFFDLPGSASGKLLALRVFRASSAIAASQAERQLLGKGPFGNQRADWRRAAERAQ